MLKIIKNTEGLRVGNFIFIDSMVIPPNFITAQAKYLDEGFEKDLIGKWENKAYLNAKVTDIEQLLPNEKDGIYSKDGFTAKKIQDATHDQFIIWEVAYGITGHGREVAEISFIHELQNYYKDWTGKDLIKIKQDVDVI